MEQVRTGQVHKEQICTAQTHMEQSVTYLVRRMTEGDSQAFDQLMGYYYPKVLRMAYLISGNHADSEDIVQETFVLCWMNRKKIKEPERFSSWLYRTLTREAWRICRKSRWRRYMGRRNPRYPRFWMKFWPIIGMMSCTGPLEIFRSNRGRLWSSIILARCQQRKLQVSWAVWRELSSQGCIRPGQT